MLERYSPDKVVHVTPSDEPEGEGRGLDVAQGEPHEDAELLPEALEQDDAQKSFHGELEGLAAFTLHNGFARVFQLLAWAG